MITEIAKIGIDALKANKTAAVSKEAIKKDSMSEMAKIGGDLATKNLELDGKKDDNRTKVTLNRDTLDNKLGITEEVEKTKRMSISETEATKREQIEAKVGIVSEQERTKRDASSDMLAGKINENESRVAMSRDTQVTERMKSSDAVKIAKIEAESKSEQIESKTKIGMLDITESHKTARFGMGAQVVTTGLNKL